MIHSIPDGLGVVRDEQNVPIVDRVELTGPDQHVVVKLLEGVYKLTWTPGTIYWRSGPSHAFQPVWLPLNKDGGEVEFTYSLWWSYNRFEIHDQATLTLTRIQAPPPQQRPEPPKPQPKGGFWAFWKSL
jgi:hypothetical protein